MRKVLEVIKRHRILIAILVFLNILDGILTTIGILNFGCIDISPLANATAHNEGLYWFTKLGGTFLLIFLIAWLISVEKRLVWFLRGANIAFLVACTLNIATIFWGYSL